MLPAQDGQASSSHSGDSQWTSVDDTYVEAVVLVVVVSVDGLRREKRQLPRLSSRKPAPWEGIDVVSCCGALVEAASEKMRC